MTPRSKAVLEEQIQARYAGEDRPNYIEPEKFHDRTTGFVNESTDQPFYLYHKNRYSEYNR